MRFYRLWAVAWKESIHLFRDWRSLFLAVVTPLFLLILFGYALRLDIDRVPLVIWDQSNTQESRRLISHFIDSHYFSPSGGFVNNYKDLERAIDTGEALVALVIPFSFGRQVKGENKIQLIVDGSDSNSATIALGYAEAMIQQQSHVLMVERSFRRGENPVVPLLEVQGRILFNPNAESTNTIVPGLVAVIMMVISALLTSSTISREWEKGTMEQLIATPVKVFELVAGKMLPYFLIGIVDLLLIVILGSLLFQVPMRGSFLLLFAMASIFLVGSLSVGMVISIVAKSQLLSSQIAMVATFLPSFLLSGFITAINNMPIALQIVTNFVPAKYFVGLLTSLYLKGSGLDLLWMEILLLFCFAIGTFCLANLLFKKKLV